MRRCLQSSNGLLSDLLCLLTYNHFIYCFGLHDSVMRYGTLHTSYAVLVTATVEQRLQNGCVIRLVLGSDGRILVAILVIVILVIVIVIVTLHPSRILHPAHMLTRIVEPVPTQKNPLLLLIWLLCPWHLPLQPLHRHTPTHAQLICDGLLRITRTRDAELITLRERGEVRFVPHLLCH